MDSKLSLEYSFSGTYVIDKINNITDTGEINKFVNFINDTADKIQYQIQLDGTNIKVGLFKGSTKLDDEEEEKNFGR